MPVKLAIFAGFRDLVRPTAIGTTHDITIHQTTFGPSAKILPPERPPLIGEAHDQS
jgi:hypothetical protein